MVPVEKIEELTLYVIQLQQQNKTIQKRNKQLEANQIDIRKQLRKSPACRSRPIAAWPRTRPCSPIFIARARSRNWRC